ncbi:hypothetical protein [Streptomyces sp. NPDC003247]|uniref:hypothetical protein n=1 Tax=Streptomyces sp. NPDC003247 TaxID=3364677 RepID=UPI003685CA8A
MRRQLACAIGALAASGLLAACGGGGGSGGTEGPTGGGTPTSSATSAAKAYDPPLKFEDPASQHIAGGTGDGGPWTVRLDGTTAYAASTAAVKAVDVVDGTALWSVEPQGEPVSNTDYLTDVKVPPVVVPVEGKSAVLAAFGVTVPGSGTTPDRNTVELSALAADSGKQLWTTTLEWPDGVEEDAPVVLGSDGTDAVVTLGTDHDAVTFGIALDSHTTAWTAKGFAAKFVDGATVVGLVDTNGETDGGITVQAIGAADGKAAWTYSTPELNGAVVTSVGAGLFTADVDPHEYDEEDSVALLSTANGRAPAGYAAAGTAGLSALSCLFDDEDTFVCSSSAEEAGGKRVFALDANTFDELWAIKEGDTDRLLPEVSTVWHGAVYADTDNGAVILDARTGKDKATEPGVTPFAVNAYAGLVSTSATGIEAHRAIG